MRSPTQKPHDGIICGPDPPPPPPFGLVFAVMGMNTIDCDVVVLPAGGRSRLPITDQHRSAEGGYRGTFAKRFNRGRFPSQSFRLQAEQKAAHSQNQSNPWD